MFRTSQIRVIHRRYSDNEFSILCQARPYEYIPEEIWFLPEASFTPTTTSLETLDNDPDADCER